MGESRAWLQQGHPKKTHQKEISMDELELDETTTHWLAIIGVLTLGVALIFLLARKIAR